MIQSRQKAVRQKITQSFSPDLEISFPSLGNDEGIEGLLIIESEIGVPGLWRDTYAKKPVKIIPLNGADESAYQRPTPSVNKVKEERVKVAINPEHPEQTVMIGSDLTNKIRSKLCNLLQRSLDIFSWTPTDMTDVPRQIAEHRLNVRKGCQSVRQKKRGQAAERNVAINDEVSKLVDSWNQRKVHYPLIALLNP
ncbi:hypothetical protein Tco_0378522 [Tanacetum coccineum]